MNIVAMAHYYSELNKSGGERYLQGVLEYLAKNHTVTMIETSNRAPDSNLNGVAIKYQGRGILDSFNADAYITQFGDAKDVIDLARKRKKPVIFIAHNDMAGTVETLKTLRPKDIALFNTLWLARKMNTSARKVVVHPPSDKDVYKPVDNEGQYITLVNPTLAKGASTFYNLSKHYPKRKFLVVEGGYFKHHQKLYAFPNITIQRQTEDMYNDVYKRTRIALMPSNYESWGFVAREASLCGIPVICTPTAGLVENLGDAGIYCGFNNFDAYYKAIEALDNKDYYAGIKQAHINRRDAVDVQAELQQLEGLLYA